MNDTLRNVSPSLTLTRRFVCFSVTFLVGLVASPALAFVGHSFLPTALANWLFFWPQVALAYNGFTVPAENVTRTFLDGGPNFVIAAVLWTAVGFVVSWLFRNRSVLVTLLAALPVSFLVAWVALLALSAINVGVSLDGP